MTIERAAEHKGHCRVCDGEFTLTRNGRVRSHGPRGQNCGGGSDLPREALGTPMPQRLPGEDDAEFYAHTAQWAAEHPDQDPRPTRAELEQAYRVSDTDCSESEGVAAYAIIGRAREYGVRDLQYPAPSVPRPSITAPETELSQAEQAKARIAAGRGGGPNPYRPPLATVTPITKNRPPEAPYCEKCDTDTHRCPGCGASVPHGTVACTPCNQDADEEIRRREAAQTVKEAPVAGADPAFRNNLARPAPARDDDAFAAFLGSGRPARPAAAPATDDDFAAFLAGPAQAERSGKGRWFSSRYDGDCDACGSHYDEGEEIRADGEGGWQGRECCGDDEDRGEADAALVAATDHTARAAQASIEAVQAKKARPKAVGLKPPMVNGRYKLPHPETGKPSSYMRVTNFVKLASEEYMLKQWELRSCLVGAANSPDILRQAECLDVKVDRQALDALAEQAKNAAGAKDKAGVGTVLHKWTEDVDGGRITVDDVPEEHRDAVRRYRDLVEASGYRVVSDLIERTTVLAAVGVVGTFDQVWQRLADGEYVIVDKKTGSLAFAQAEIATQLAVYAKGFNAHGIAEWTGEGRKDDPAMWHWVRPTGSDGQEIRVSEDRAVVVHLPQDGSPVQLMDVDLSHGHRGIDICQAVRGWHRVKTTMQPVEVTAPVRVSPKTPDVAAFVARLKERAGLAGGSENRPAPESETAGPSAAVAEVQQESPEAPAEPVAVPAQAVEPVQVPKRAAPAVPVSVVEVGGAAFLQGGDDPFAPLPPRVPKPTWQQRFKAVTTLQEASALWKEAKAAGMPADRLAELVAVAQEALAEPPF